MKALRMSINILLIFNFLIVINSSIFSQSIYRSGIFLHHSTGLRIWGPNGSNTSVPQEITAYNSLHGYTGDSAVTLNETYFPSADNEWYNWHKIFTNSDPNNNINPYLQNNKIIIIKSCFPSSSMVGQGIPSDTLLAPWNRTIYNYKWHWRKIVRVMQQHPQNFFVIWTNAPLVPNQTNIQEAEFSHQFCKWAKDTLAAGNDSLFGAFPSNVYIFDFFHKLVDQNWMLKLQYAVNNDDSHPNSAATELIAPQFVQETFDASIGYESAYTLNLTGFIEGLYDDLSMVEDTVTVELRKSVAPYLLLELKKVKLNEFGVGRMNFAKISEGAQYYIVVKHRNGLEMWSSNPLSFTIGVTDYDFTTDSSRAFGFNMIKRGSKWCFYSGDINHDGIIDLTDVAQVDIDNLNFVVGYTSTDITGDGLVDLSDISFVDINNLKFISRIVPNLMKSKD